MTFVPFLCWASDKLFLEPMPYLNTLIFSIDSWGSWITAMKRHMSNYIDCCILFLYYKMGNFCEDIGKNSRRRWRRFSTGKIAKSTFLTVFCLVLYASRVHDWALLYSIFLSRKVLKSASLGFLLQIRWLKDFGEINIHLCNVI